MTDFQAVILAAGKGTRMKSERAKVLHEVADLPMLGHVIDTAIASGAGLVTVVLGHQIDAVRHWLAGRYGDAISVAEQREQLGTGHAVWSAKEALKSGASKTLILSGDVPNLGVETLRAFVEASHGFDLSLITADVEDAGQYGRILRDGDAVVGIVEFKDATPAQRTIREINAGCYLVDSALLYQQLERLCAVAANNAANEYYLTDVVAAVTGSHKVFGYKIVNTAEIQGVNTRLDLAAAEAVAQERINRRWMLAGVTMHAPQTIRIGADVVLDEDVTLHPGVVLRGRTSIGRGCLIETGTVLDSAQLGQDVHVKPYCVVTDSPIGDNSVIGPFAHLRPDSIVGRGCKIGNFVETKNTTLADGAKASHLSYLGDATVGANANVGAGTITCNYDGKNKHRTTIGDGSFVGSNSALVAPVTIGSGAYVGAGSVITVDIPDGALGVARGRQKNIENWARRRRSSET
ncbi:MAG: bifunctional UDP-N-acetylglucosamine diphosphorylase/glucosamine-1-phosphate N-acetyltransferase GlmU [bacterium]